MEKQKKKTKNNVKGILLLDKPIGMSSNRLLQTVKKIYNAKKAGHTGSLDVPASGLLPICFGEATKVSGYLLNSNKKYFVKCSLGITTTTGDASGEARVTRKIPKISEIKLGSIVKNYVGNIQQVPPMFSSLKHNGKRLYELAYKGIEVQRKAREIRVYSIKLLRFNEDYFEIEVFCSKGTYIRTLVEDIGEEIGCGAHVSSLRRLEAGPFNLLDAAALEEIESTAKKGKQALYDLLLPMDTALKEFPKILLADDKIYSLRQGQSIEVSDIPKLGQLRIYNSSNEFIGLGDAVKNNQIKAKRLINIV
mgnify:CR=1 FL=1